jgi:probable F420-dependent oxidoreductase
VKYAVVAPVEAGVTADPAWIAAFARHVEVCGFEEIDVVEHAVLATAYDSVYPYDPSGRVGLAPDCPVPDPLELLTFIAAHTTTLRLAPGVLVLPNHHPVVLAKRVATVDTLSGGRLRLCVGVGWLREEIEACGAPFGHRGRRADEQLEVMRLLWAGDAKGVTHKGEFFEFANVVSLPKPVQGNRLPVHIGGHSVAAARRAGRLGDGLQPLGVGGPALTSLTDAMREEAQRTGRDPAVLQLSLGHAVDKIDAGRAEKLAGLGADRIVLAMPPLIDIEAAKDALSACAQRLGLTT